MALAQYVTGTRTFWRQVRDEFRKVTWPDRVQLRQATGAIVVFVIFIGLVIYAMDLVLQGVLVRAIPALFGVK